MAKVTDGIRYAERVVAGEVIACEFVRLSCQRFLDDLRHGEERGIYFSEPRAQHILNFYKFVPHVKGALAGQPIELMGWHVFILINIFGGILRCDVLATGVVQAAQHVNLSVPVVVRMEGTNVEAGRRILAESGLKLINAADLADAAQKVAEIVN